MPKIVASQRANTVVAEVNVFEVIALAKPSLLNGGQRSVRHDQSSQGFEGAES